MKKQFIYTFLISFLLLINVSTITLADSNDDDEDLFEIEQSWDKVKIKYEYEIDTDGIEYEIEYEIEIDTHSGTGLSIEVEYEEGDEDENFKLGEELELKVTYDSLTEYLDLNNNNVLEAEDTIIQTIRLNALTFDFLEIIPVSENNVNGYEVTVLGYLDTFEFGIVVYLWETTQSGISINHAKIDIIINNFPFQTADGKLLLVAELGSVSNGKSFEKENEKEKENENGVEMLHPLGRAEYIIDPYAQVDGTTQAVKVYEQLSTDGELAYSYSSYPQGSEIYHDPLFGVTPKKVENGGLTNDVGNFYNDREIINNTTTDAANIFSFILISISFISVIILKRNIIGLKPT